MFIKKLEKTFGFNTPIFSDDIVKLFNNFTKAYVFRLIKKAEDAGELVSYSRGVYFIPRKTFFGQSTISPEMVVEKRYLKDGDSVYGIYAGLNLLNQFGITTQVPNTIEIVTNNETTRKRKITINRRDFILRKSRCMITEDNYPEYTLLQLFSEMNEKDEFSELSKIQVKKFIEEKRLTKERLFLMSGHFPAVAAKNMIKYGVLYGAL